jgi:CheY-like chemotaxis protein
MTERGPIVHVVDDDDSVRTGVVRLLQAAGYEARGYASAGEFLLRRSDRNAPGCVVLDVRLPGPSGLDLQEALARLVVPLPIVFLTGHGDIPMSVRAIKGGAVDFTAGQPGYVARRGADRARARCRDTGGACASARVARTIRDAHAAGARGLRWRCRRQAEQAGRARFALRVFPSGGRTI